MTNRIGSSDPLILDAPILLSVHAGIVDCSNLRTTSRCIRDPIISVSLEGPVLDSALRPRSSVAFLRRIGQLDVWKRRPREDINKQEDNEMSSTVRKEASRLRWFGCRGLGLGLELPISYFFHSRAQRDIYLGDWTSCSALIL